VIEDHQTQNKMMYRKGSPDNKERSALNVGAAAVQTTGFSEATISIELKQRSFNRRRQQSRTKRRESRRSRNGNGNESQNKMPGKKTSERDIGCSKTTYPNGLLLLWANLNCPHQSLRRIHGLHENLGSCLEEMAGKMTT
jgi:hypothetical protein